MMSMKYLVLRKINGGDAEAFRELVTVSASAEEFEFPYSVDGVELDDTEVGDALHDPDVDDVVLSIPFTLIEPFKSSADLPETSISWGIETVRAATSPHDGRGVTVAILDTGIDLTHEAFAGLMFPSAHLMDFSVDETGRAGSAADQHGHGTHVAGTIAGRPVNGQRIGVAPGIERVLIGKVLGPKGAPTEAVFNAITWALRERADIVSMSLGIDFPRVVSSLIANGLPPDIAAARALEAYRSNVRLFDRLAELVEARAKQGRGALLIAAAGNESRRKKNPEFTVPVAPPAAADGFISVGAVGRAATPEFSLEVAAFSNTGCLLSAPGVSILSAKLGGGLVSQDGTSMATPHVAGVAALWTQKLFPGPVNRPPGWAKDVQRYLETYARSPEGLTRNDIGLGIAQAPQA
jgi:subtilisin family serine protease